MLRIRTYIWATILAAIFAAAYSATSAGSLNWSLIAVLGALSLLAEWLAFSIPFGGTVSLAFGIHYAAVLLGGPLVGAVVALFGAVSPQDVSSGKPPIRMAFNAAQFVLSALAAGAVYVGLGGQPLLGAPTASLQQWIWPALVAAPIQAVVNMALVGAAMALSSGITMRRVWASTFRSYLVNMLALTLLGLVLAQLVVAAGFVSVGLLVIPFLVARQTFRVYQQQTDAYINTVKSLVAAVEAKDPYTRGHSERVADLARDTAVHMGLGAREVERITWAALLHDIGKIALSTALLRKPTRLTHLEMAEVRSHPSLASEILAEIDFLDDIVPFVAAHHEWHDGRGYPLGLSGDDIPLGARILAVADSYDAMTSTRPYRPALPADEARRELKRGALTQFDPHCVDALIAVSGSHPSAGPSSGMS